MEIQMMTRSHISQIAALEKACFSMPWSDKAIESELTNPLSLWLVALDGDRVTGYVGSQSVMGEADMMNIAVAAPYRRQGVAQSLICALMQALKNKDVRCLTLEVRVSNAAALAMYEKLGFAQIGRRPGYYTAPKEDALILRKEWEV